MGMKEGENGHTDYVHAGETSACDNLQRSSSPLSTTATPTVLYCDRLLLHTSLFGLTAGQFKFSMPYLYKSVENKAIPNPCSS